jgi:hypothetical protein
VIGHLRSGHFVGHPFSIEHAVERPQTKQHRQPGVFNTLGDAIERSRIEDRPGDDKVRSGFDLVLEPPHLAIEIVSARVQGDADVKRCRRADRLSPDVRAVIETRHRVEQTDRVDIDNRRRIGVVAHQRHVTSDQHHVADAHCVCTEQIGLQVEQTAIARRTLQHGFDAGPLLDQDG